MQSEAAERQGAGISAGDLATLLEWWKLSGVDVAVGESPTTWLMGDGPELAGDSPAQQASETSPSPKRPAPKGQARPIAPGADPYAAIQSLDELRALVLAESPRAPFADGNAESGLMILGEAPSAEDLRTGRPFSGPAGQFLDRMLAAIGIDRQSCYISLLAPRMDRPGPPPEAAIQHDLALTHAHIRLARPRFILLLGAIPVRVLTSNDTPIGRIRGSWLGIEAGQTPALATFNPAYLLRRPEEKANIWADLLALKKRLTE